MNLKTLSIATFNLYNLNRPRVPVYTDRDGWATALRFLLTEQPRYRVGDSVGGGDGLAINNDHLNFDKHKEDGTNDHGIIRAEFKHKPIKGGA